MNDTTNIPGDTLEDNVRYLLANCPFTVKDMSGDRTGIRGREDLAGSLAITFLKMQGLALREDRQPADAAIRTLQFLGYTYHGAEQWKPPLGPSQDAIDAQKWRTMIHCARLRPLGSAGIEKDSEHDPDSAHLGFELWTKHPPFEHLDAQRALGIRWLDKFVEKALRVAAKAP